MPITPGSSCDPGNGGLFNGFPFLSNSNAKSWTNNPNSLKVLPEGVFITAFVPYFSGLPVLGS